MPLFATPRALALSYYEGYIDFTGRVKAYAVVDLRVLGGYDWRLSPKNVWKVEQLLLDWPHRKIASSDARADRCGGATRVPRSARLQAVEVLLGPRALGAAAPEFATRVVVRRALSGPSQVEVEAAGGRVTGSVSACFSASSNRFDSASPRVFSFWNDCSNSASRRAASAARISARPTVRACRPAPARGATRCARG
jgi:hypothetical protein